MKKILGILLFLSLLIPYLGTYTWLRYKINAVKSEVSTRIKAGIEKKDLVLLKFSIRDSETRLRWKHAKEFEFQGQMFDIVTRELHGDSISFYCLKDHEESTINRHIKSLAAKIAGQDPVQRDNHQRLNNFYKSLYNSIPFSLSLSTPEIQMEQGFYSYAFNYSSIQLPPPSPPPEIV